MRDGKAGRRGDGMDKICGLIDRTISSEWQNELPNPSGKAKTASEMEIELQQE